MTTLIDAAQKALEALEEKPDSDGHCRQAAAELRRLEAEVERKAAVIKFLWNECDRQEALNAQLLEALVDIAYRLEKARIWGGMEWKYNPLHPMHYLPARDKARAAIKAAKGEA
jgi:ParB-like chromosome segregation protein Spo0J